MLKNKTNKIVTVAGFNQYHQLSIGTNASKEDASTFQPTNIPFDLSSHQSYSIYSEHSVLINKKGIALAIGSNLGQKIMKSNNKQFDKWTQVQFTFGESKIKYFSTAVCGGCYTIYNVMSSIPLVLVQWENKYDGMPIVVEKYTPVSFFGGNKTAAFIDDTNQIIMLTPKTVPKKLEPFKPYTAFLPPKEQPTQIACLEKTFIALSKSGTLYEFSFSKKRFSVVKTLSNDKFIGVSGTSNHCIAITSNGKIFVRGSNNHGQLGILSEEEEEDDDEYDRLFIELKPFSDQLVINAFAGYDHSLFLMESGSIYVCGNNLHNQLLIKKGNDPKSKCIKYPILSSIQNDSSFCIAGNQISVVFHPNNQPHILPNSIISDKSNQSNNVSKSNKIAQKSQNNVFESSNTMISSPPNPSIIEKQQKVINIKCGMLLSEISENVNQINNMIVMQNKAIDELKVENVNLEKKIQMIEQKIFRLLDNVNSEA